MVSDVDEMLSAGIDVWILYVWFDGDTEGRFLGESEGGFVGISVADIVRVLDEKFEVLDVGNVLVIGLEFLKVMNLDCLKDS